VVCNVTEFHAVNEQYGRQFGDLVLRSIGISLRKLARKTGGIGCRKGSDAFLLYCPHREDYETLIRRLLEDLFVEKETASKVKLRFGVFAGSEQVPDVEERFACASLAAESVKEDPQRICGYYQYRG
jgi:GGDEF domain-containing protein